MTINIPTPERPLAAVEGLIVGGLTVEVVMAHIGLLPLAQGAKAGRHGCGARDAAGIEELTDGCQDSQRWALQAINMRFIGKAHNLKSEGNKADVVL